ncbi:probably inactive leucine-rich repeat receptor-like protein kinase At5g06940 [Cynara cardunculus var. scolymus]|uniref:probably inactive leucine-rich repeat receptor-like protein kinase At5g06940 n=1 Tax=Cynara cardunculus var. scolymus TaxID=59895 RepID=UPI000D62BB74|nr:probably inactive leucine-rich repeat receptor-like protein kinase At5g06940 [Cynara cardunculus var. scolymus]
MASYCTLSLSLTFLFSSLLISTINASSEPDILLTFKSAIDDPMNSLSSWSNATTTHHCNWTGVACTTAATVSSLTLQNLNLSGEISPSICQLSDIITLNLADNFFNQPIPLHLSQCSSLNTLNLSNNLIWGTIPDQISEFKSLMFLDLSKNHVEGKIPDGVGSLLNLQVLNLGNNLLSGSVPLVLGNFTDLIVLDLSLNPFMESEIPSDIGKLLKLEQVLLQRSGFYGEIPSSIVDLKGLTVVDLSENNLTGVLPSRIGSSLTKLVSFDVSQNNLFGSFPNGICEANGLATLSLHTNNFNGTLPNTSIANCLNLERLELQNNGFHGDFPNNLWSLPKIKLIRAENNRFSGEIPDSVSMASQLEQVQIDNNSFISKIPHGLGLVKSLYRFSASLNGLYGELPPNFCDSPVMSIINFSHNYIAGEIPELKQCKKLVSLSLADNNFVGEIPVSLGDLPVLTYLDLSHNNLTGEIPLELQNLKLALFNVSFNRLSGRVPSSLIAGLPALYIQGNPELCGPGLSNSCSNEGSNRRIAGISKLACALISLALLAGLLSLAFGFYVIRKASKRKSETGIWRSVFFYPLRVTEQDLIIAMDEKASRGSSGAFGRVYIVNLPSNELVAVKKIPTFGNQSFKTLRTEVKTLAKIRHKNVVRILGFCHSYDSIFLIYECLEKGSLGDLIGKGEFQLAWNFRLKIAIGIAQGLAYLHKDYVPHLLHRDVKSKNILLDSEFEPKLTDFALDRLLGETAFQSSMDSISASSCYMAPEFGYNKKATEQMDTYGFGVILLELVTGRAAEQIDSSEETLDVVKWVRRKVNISNGAVQVLDPKLSSSCQQDALGMLEIGLQCTSVMPEKRPSMFEAVAALQSLGSKPRLTSLDLSASSHSVPV